MGKFVGIYESLAIPGLTNTGQLVGRLATRYQGRFQSDDALLTAQLKGGRNSQVLACDRRLLRGDDFCSFDDCSPGEWGGGRQAEVGENARPWLQHMGALRPDLPIEAMIKMKMVAVETGVLRP